MRSLISNSRHMYPCQGPVLSRDAPTVYFDKSLNDIISWTHVHMHTCIPTAQHPPPSPAHSTTHRWFSIVRIAIISYLRRIAQKHT